MGNTNSTVEDNTLNDKNLVHSGSELNIGFVNVHTETINHGIKVFSILLGLFLIIIIVCKCNPMMKLLYKKCFKKQRNRYMEYQHFLARNNFLTGHFQGNHQEIILPQIPLHSFNKKDIACQTDQLNYLYETVV